MAATSEARIRANRLNAQKSTGPKTAEGKAKARVNAVKHGLTGAGVALPTEDAAMVEGRFLSLQEAMAPSDLASAFLVHQMALMSVRIDRAATHEAAVLAMKIRHAADDFDLHRLDEVDRLFGSIETDPGANRRRLLRQPEGIDKLFDALASARQQLRNGSYRRWTEQHHNKVEAFLGGNCAQFPGTRTDALLLALLKADYAYLEPGELDDLESKDARAGWARDQLIPIIDVELGKLEVLRGNFDHQRLATDRLGAATRDRFDQDPNAIAARKYAAEAVRHYSKALRDFHQNEAMLAEPETRAKADTIEAPQIVDQPTVASTTVAAEVLENEPNVPTQNEANPEPDVQAPPVFQNEPRPAPMAPLCPRIGGDSPPINNIMNYRL